MPRLSVDIEARYSKYLDALDQITRNTDSSVKQMSAAFGTLKAGIAGLGTALSAGAFVALIKASIDSADHLNDLSKSTGVAVETLGGLGFAARQSGSDLDGIAKAFGKLNLKIAEATAGNEAALAPFQAIGISLKDLQALKPDEVFARIATAFASYEDGPNKAALGNAFFKKSYQDIIPTLDEGGAKLAQNLSYFEKYGGVTADIAQKSDDFNDSLAKLNLLSGAFFRTVAADLLPTLQELVNIFIASKEKGTGFATVAGDLAEGFRGLVILGANVGYVFKGIGAELGGIAAQADALAHLDFQAFSAIGEAMKKDAEDARKSIDAFSARIQNPTGAGPGGAVSGSDIGGDVHPARLQAPGFKDQGGLLANDAARKKILEGQIKDLERFAQGEASALAHAGEILQLYYQQDLVSLADYATQRQALLDKTVAAQADAIDKEIALLRASRNRGDEANAADVDNKIEALQNKRTKLQADAAHETQKQAFENKTAYDGFLRTLEDINVTLLEQQGQLARAAGARFDLGHEQIIKKITTERDSALDKGDTDTAAARDADLAKEAILKRLTVAQGDLNELSVKTGSTRAALSAEEERSLIAVTNGTETQEESIQRVVAARQLAILELTRQADAQKAVADSLPENTAAHVAALESVKAFRLEIEKLAADTEQLATSRDFSAGFDKAFRQYIDKANDAADQGRQVFDIASKTIGDGFYDALQGNFKNIGSSFKQLVDRMVADFLAAQALIKLKELAGNLFGGGGGGGGESGAAYAELAASLFEHGAVLNSGNVIAFAGGGIVNRPTVFPMARGQVGLMGEAGPEAVVPLRRGRDGKLGIAGGGGGTTININQAFAPGTDKRTIDQAARAVGEVSQRALRRNG